MTRRILFLIGVFIVGLVVVSNTNEAVADSIAYIMRRFTNFNSDLNGARMSSTKYRIVGHIFINKIKNSFYTVKTDIFNSGHE